MRMDIATVELAAALRHIAIDGVCLVQMRLCPRGLLLRKFDADACEVEMAARELRLIHVGATIAPFVGILDYHEGTLQQVELRLICAREGRELLHQQTLHRQATISVGLSAVRIDEDLPGRPGPLDGLPQQRLVFGMVLVDGARTAVAAVGE